MEGDGNGVMYFDVKIMSLEMQQLKTENEQLTEYLERLNEDLREAKSLAHGLKEKVGRREDWKMFFC